MPDLSHEVLEVIRTTARDELEFEGPIELAHSLQADLQLDSMAMIVVAVALENRFKVRLREEDAGEICTVADLVALVTRRTEEKHSAHVSAQGAS